MRVDAAARRMMDAFVAMDDGALMRNAFLALLAAAAVFIAIDWTEINAAGAGPPGIEPMRPDALPALPPALTQGLPRDAPSEVRSDPQKLRQAIRFELIPGGVLLAEGAIDPGAAARFATEIETRGEYVRTVLLDSPGGSVDDALAISRLIRDRQLGTKVAAGALCASSCPIVLAGGTRREAEEGAVVGVHQVFGGIGDRPSPAQAMSDAQATTARVSRHLAEMGIGPGLWLHALETPPDRLYYLTQEEMRALALVTPPATALGRSEAK